MKNGQTSIRKNSGKSRVSFKITRLSLFWKVKMDRLKKTLKDEFWVVLLDILAVNLSYFIALILRGMIDGVGFHYGESFSVFSGIFYRFAPWYTICCLIVFSALHL